MRNDRRGGGGGGAGSVMTGGGGGKTGGFYVRARRVKRRKEPWPGRGEGGSERDTAGVTRDGRASDGDGMRKKNPCGGLVDG